MFQNKTNRIMALVFGFGLIVFFFQNCGGDFKQAQYNSADLPADEELKDLDLKIEQMVKNSHCEKSEECQALPIGVKPCGGPWSYVIFSISSTDIDQLQEKIDIYNEAQKEANERDQLVSDCMYVMPPEDLICEENKCKVGLTTTP